MYPYEQRDCHVGVLASGSREVLLVVYIPYIPNTALHIDLNINVGGRASNACYIYNTI